MTQCGEGGEVMTSVEREGRSCLVLRERVSCS